MKARAKNGISSHANVPRGGSSRKKEAAASAYTHPAAQPRVSASTRQTQQLPGASNLASVNQFSAQPLGIRPNPQVFDAPRDRTLHERSPHSGRSGVYASLRTAPAGAADSSTLEPSSHYDTASTPSRLVGTEMVDGLDLPQTDPDSDRRGRAQTFDGAHIFLPRSNSRPDSQSGVRPGLRPATGGHAYPLQAPSQKQSTPIRQPGNAQRAMTAPEGPSTSSQSLARPETPQVADGLATHVRNHLRETKRFAEDVQQKFDHLKEALDEINDEMMSEDHQDLQSFCRNIMTSQSNLEAEVPLIKDLIQIGSSRVTESFEYMERVLETLRGLMTRLDQVSAAIDKIESAQADEIMNNASRHKELTDDICKVKSLIAEGVERVSDEVKGYTDQGNELLRTECQKHQERIQKYEEARKLDEQKYQQSLRRVQELLQSLAGQQQAHNHQSVPLGQNNFASRRNVSPSTPVTSRGASPAPKNDEVMPSDTAVRDSDRDSALDNYNFGHVQDRARPARGGERRKAPKAYEQHLPPSRHTSQSQRAFQLRDNKMEDVMESRPPSPAPPPPAAEAPRNGRGRLPAEPAVSAKYGRSGRKRALAAEDEAEGEVQDAVAYEAEGEPEPQYYDRFEGPSASRAATRGRRSASISSSRAAKQRSAEPAGRSRYGEDRAPSSKPTTKGSKRSAAKSTKKPTAKKAQQKRRKFDDDDEEDEEDVDDNDEDEVGNDRGGGDKYVPNVRTEEHAEAAVFGERYPTRARKPVERYGAKKRKR